MKVHEHSEQFDGWHHAWCGALSAPPDDPRIVEDLATVPRERRCRRCAKNWHPGPGEPK